METNIRQLFKAVGDKNLPVAKSLITGVNEELKYLSAIIGKHDTGENCISKINDLVKSVESRSINVAWGKVNTPLEAAYSGHLENHLKQRLVLSRTPQDRTVKLPSGPGQINDRNRDQRSVQDFNGSGKLNSSSTEKETNLQNVQRKQYNDNIEVTYLQQQHTYAETGLKNYETSKLDKSKIASQLLRDNNPDITDLSDTNRPTKLAERFSELYDNEWTEAFESISKVKKDERKIIEFLLEIIENAYVFCSENITLLKEKLRVGKIVQLDERNKCAASEIQTLKEKFCDDVIPEISPNFTIQKDDAIEQYAKKAVELAYWMNIHDPPVYMVLSQQSNHEFDPNLYRAYTKSGRKAEFFVWPPLTLYKDGGVLCKGVVQFK